MGHVLILSFARCSHSEQLALRYSGNIMLCRISVVALNRARLVLRWVSVCGQVNRLGTKPAS